MLRFSEERDPAAVAQFVRLRVIDPEGAYWRCGIEAAGATAAGDRERCAAGAVHGRHAGGWGAVGGYPLGQWVAEQRRAYAAGTLEAGRVAELERLGMVWSEQEAAWADGVAVAREYPAAHGHFLRRPRCGRGIRSGCGRRTRGRRRVGRGRTRSSARPAAPSPRRPGRSPGRGRPRKTSGR
ncbi:helicase associated domain-containing protein [Streptomyces gelaticus]|uniref:helicase associated domain-containing protein n=1 Tax=Streptomyces gelaticus TaxID=285446 RepID=UPI00379345D8